MKRDNTTMIQASISSSMEVNAFFHSGTCTFSYLILDRQSRQCALIDSVLDYDPNSGRICTTSADRLIARVLELGATVQWILETHVHADHLSASPYLKRRLGGQTAIGSHITAVQKVFGALFNAGPDFEPDGGQFDRLWHDGDTFTIGALLARAMHTPGHTPACITYVISDGHEMAAFVGDTLFMPDSGTARCDFPGGDARTLYRSIDKVLSLPTETRLYLCHDYQPGGRELSYVTTVADQRANNIHVRDGIGEEEFAVMRQERDATLPMPALLLPSVQVNMRAGELPTPETNGKRYLKIPINALAAANCSRAR